MNKRKHSQWAVAGFVGLAVGYFTVAGALGGAPDLTINRAAEAAVPQAKTLLVGAVESMSIADAKGILTGGDEAAAADFIGKVFGALRGS